MEKVWYTIENITYDKDSNKISGNCIDGVYLGVVEIYLPPNIDTDALEDGMSIKALCGMGMTMSLPPQIMGCSEILIVETDTVESEEMKEKEIEECEECKMIE